MFHGRVKFQYQHTEMKSRWLVNLEKTNVTYQAITLLGSLTTTCTEQMAAFSRFWTKASTLPALGAAVDLGEFLAVIGAITPATRLARRMAWCARTLGKREVVYINIFGILSSDYFLPIDCFDVAKVVVIKHSNTSTKNICNINNIRKNIDAAWV